MNKNIICFFIFSFITRNVRVGRIRESRRWLSLHTHTHTHTWGWWYRSSVKPLCLSSSFFFFLVTGHMASSRQRIFLISPRFSTFTGLLQIRLKTSNYHSVFSLLYSGQSGARPDARATWCLVDIFYGLLVSARLCWLYNILDSQAYSSGHISLCIPPTQFLRNFHVGTTSVQFTLRKMVHFLFYHPCNLCSMSKKSTSQYLKERSVFGRGQPAFSLL